MCNTKTKICKHCGKEFKAEHSEQKFCNRECRLLETVLPILICPVCGKEFAPKTKTSKYCSKNCSGIGRRKLKKMECPICGKIFKQHNRSTQFCSRECANIAQTASNIKCPICGKEFHPRSGQKYCSNKCLGKSKIKLEDKKCKFCGKDFHPKDSTQQFCCKECHYKSRATLHNKQCELCGKGFKPHYKEQQYCSNECAKSVRAIADIECGICGKIFHPTSRNIKYCSQQCKGIARSNYINSLPEEEKIKRMQPLFNAEVKAKSSNNIKFAQFLNDNGYNIDIGEKSKDMEFLVGERSFDIKVENTLVEINPHTYHNVTKAPRGLPKRKNYHKEKAMLALKHGYNIIMVWDWDDKRDILNLLNGAKYSSNKIKIGLDKCMYSDIINLGYKLINISEPTAHWYNPKTGEHIIDTNDNMLNMIEKGFVKIYDCGRATFIYTAG